MVGFPESLEMFSDLFDNKVKIMGQIKSDTMAIALNAKSYSARNGIPKRGLGYL